MPQTIKEKYENADTWQEKANTINFYHKLMKLKKKKHGLKETALYFDGSVSRICEDIQLAENMDFVSICPSRKMAIAMLKSKPDVVPIKPTTDNGKS